MKVKRFRDPVTKRWKYKTDFTCANVRHRLVADTTEELYDQIDAIKRKARRTKHDLPVERGAVTVAQLVAERVKDFDTENNRSQRHTEVVLEGFRDHFPPGQLVEHLSAADLLAFKRARLDAFRRKRRRAMKPNSINRELEAITAMLRAAGRYFDGFETWKPPAAPYEAVPEEGRSRVITHEEHELVLRELRAPRRLGSPATATRGPRARPQVLAWRARLVVADLWELAPHVGMRLNEMRKMLKRWIDWEAETVTLPPTAVKTRKGREVPLNEVALAILRRRCEESKDLRYVFTGSRGTGLLGEYQMRRHIKKAAERARVDYGRDVENGFVFHDTRHTAVTRMLQRGVDLATVGDIVGHSKKTMTLKYGHSTLDSKRRAVQSLVRNRRRPAKKLTA